MEHWPEFLKTISKASKMLSKSLSVMLLTMGMVTALSDPSSKSYNRSTFVTTNADTDPNKVLSEFIWSKIISTSKSESPLSASSIFSALNKATPATASSMAPFEGPPPKSLLKAAEKILSTSSISRFNGNKHKGYDSSNLAMSGSMQQPRIDSRLVRRSSLFEAPQDNQFTEHSQSFEYNASPAPSSSESDYQQEYNKPLNQIKKLKQSTKMLKGTKSSISYGQQSTQQPKQNNLRRLESYEDEQQDKQQSRQVKPQSVKTYSSYSGSSTGRNYFGTMQSQSSNKNTRSMYNTMPMSSSYGDSNQEQVPEYNSLSDAQFENNPIIKGKRTLEIAPLIGANGKQSDYGMEPQIIDVGPDDQPIQVVFRSSSTRVKVQQIHTPTKPEETETIRTEEEPQRVLHQLVRPVIQEVREIILPMRNIVQEIRPVMEQIHTVISKQQNPQEQQQQQYGAQMQQEQSSYFGGEKTRREQSQPKHEQQYRLESVNKAVHSSKTPQIKMVNYG